MISRNSPASVLEASSYRLAKSRRGAADIDNERTGSATNVEWAAYGGDTRNTKYSPASQIDASNASKLKVVWRWSSPDNDILKQHADLHLNLF